MEEVKLPELGENIDVVEVAAVLVEVGDRVNKDQPLLEVETEKANLEVPAPSAGTVAELLVGTGDQIRVGQVIAKLEGDVAGGPETSAKQAKKAPRQEKRQNQAEAARDEQEDRQPAKTEDTEEAKPETGQEPEADARSRPAESEPSERETPREATESKERESVIEFPVKRDTKRSEIGPTVAAAPTVRRLARELGVDIHQVQGSGPGGRISRDDVKAHAKQLLMGLAATSAPAAAGAGVTLPDFSQWGEIATEPLSNIRRATAKNMANAWATVPHVTQFDRADVTQLESMRKRFNKREESEGRKLSMTAIVIKTVAAALRRYPKFNASLDLMRDVIIYKKYCHVGVAVDTERGLLVPVIRDVDRKNLVQVSEELGDLASRAREKKLKPDELNGACFTVSNLGGLGTTYFSPIVNWPQVAILGVGRAEYQAVYDEGQFQPRLVMPLSISYDHRVIDGAEAARFLRWLAEALEQPLLLLLDE